MENIGEVYYERGMKFFELEQYEQAVEDWIQAYELGCKKEQILQNIYQCFIIPNKNEFQKNYKENSKEFTKLSYESCTLDFIPVSEERFYIFDREEGKFQGFFPMEKTWLQGKRVEFSSILYTDTWDIREVVSDMRKKCYGTVYVLLEQLESKFASFFKLPSFKEMYMGRIVMFHNLLEMKHFFKKNEVFYLPKQMVTKNVSKYLDIIYETQKEKQCMEETQKGKNILFLEGGSQYGALRRMVNEAAEAFRKKGYNILVLDAMKESWLQQINVAKSKYDFEAVITCNGILMEIEKFRKLGKKYCTIMGDHPIWHNDRLEAADQDTIVWYGDQNDVKYVKKYYPNVGRVDFCLGSSTALDDNIKYSERIFDIVFIGGYNKPEEIYEQICQMYEESNLEIAKKFIQRLIENPNKTYEQGLKETLEDYVQGEIDETIFKKWSVSFRIVNRYIRAYFRDKIIHQILQNNIKIHVSGNGWENFKSEYVENLIIENNDWYTAKKMLANAKISLNIMPWFKAGLHDRIVTTLLSGAVLLTDSSEYIEQHFQDMENIAVFHLEELEMLPLKIKYLLSHENIAEKIAINGQKIAREEYTWDSRVKQMVKILKEELGDKTEFTGEGRRLSVEIEGAQRKEVALDIMEELKDIESILNSFQTGIRIGRKDYQYCVSRLKQVTREFLTEFPNAEVGTYVWSIITNLSEDMPPYISELIKMQISYLVKSISWDCLK